MRNVEITHPDFFLTNTSSSIPRFVHILQMALFDLTMGCSSSRGYLHDDDWYTAPFFKTR